MKALFVLRAATVVLSIGIGSAYAGDGDGAAANTLFTEIPGVVPQAPVQSAPSVAMAQNGRAIHTYGTRALDQGVWLFAPNETGGGGGNQ
jgi:hypothetical protein